MIIGWNGRYESRFMIIISNQVYRAFLSAKGDLLKCSVPGGEKNSWVIVDRGGGGVSTQFDTLY